MKATSMTSMAVLGGKLFTYYNYGFRFLLCFNVNEHEIISTRNYKSI